MTSLLQNVTRLPAPPRLPSDLVQLSVMGPDRWVAKLEQAAKRERIDYIASLISEALANGPKF